MAEIPLIDLADLGLENRGEILKETAQRVSHELHLAFSSVGFVYLINHGVGKKLVEDVLESSRTFFNFPKEIKDEYPWDINSFEGYTGPDREIFESNTLHELREAFDATSPSCIFPDVQSPNLGPSMNQLAAQLCSLTSRLLNCMSLALGLEEDYLDSRHKFMYGGKAKNGTILRTLFYPKLSDDDVRTGVVRCGEHSDYGTITLLIQDDMGGLEVKTRNNEWIPAPPIPGTILVNLGDLMQFWTSERYKATFHRVRVPEGELRRRCVRQSIAFFVNPDNGVVISPLHKESSNEYPPVEALTYLKQRLSETYKY